ncbi:hypothetical protein PMAYCL1PPCAC_04214, partial [Pristionchus mayeri]
FLVDWKKNKFQNMLRFATFALLILTSAILSAPNHKHHRDDERLKLLLNLAPDAKFAICGVKLGYLVGILAEQPCPASSSSSLMEVIEDERLAKHCCDGLCTLRRLKHRLCLSSSAYEI